MKKNKKNNPGEKPLKLWTLVKAQLTIPLIRRYLGDLKTNFILYRHLYKRNGYSDEGEHGPELNRVVAECLAIVKDMDSIGVLPYQSPLRGIALYPTLVHYNDGKGRTPREAYFVYKDTRQTIDSYIFADNLANFSELYSWEKPIPDAWVNRDQQPEINTREQS